MKFKKFSKINKVIIFFIIILLIIIPIVFFYIYKIFDVHSAPVSRINYLKFLGNYIGSIIGSIIGLIGIILTIFYSSKNTRKQLNQSKQDSFDNSIYLINYKETGRSINKVTYFCSELVQIAGTAYAIANNIKLNKHTEKNHDRNVKDIHKLETKMSQVVPDMTNYFRVESMAINYQITSLAAIKIRDKKKINNFNEISNMESSISNTYGMLLINSYNALINKENPIKWLLEISKDSKKVFRICNKLIASLSILQNIVFINEGIKRDKLNRKKSKKKDAT